MRIDALAAHEYRCEDLTCANIRSCFRCRSDDRGRVSWSFTLIKTRACLNVYYCQSDHKHVDKHTERMDWLVLVVIAQFPLFATNTRTCTPISICSTEVALTRAVSNCGIIMLTGNYANMFVRLHRCRDIAGRATYVECGLNGTRCTRAHELLQIGWHCSDIPGARRQRCRETACMTQRSEWLSDPFGKSACQQIGYVRCPRQRSSKTQPTSTSNCTIFTADVAIASRVQRLAGDILPATTTRSRCAINNIVLWMGEMFRDDYRRIQVRVVYPVRCVGVSLLTSSTCDHQEVNAVISHYEHWTHVRSMLCFMDTMRVRTGATWRCVLLSINANGSCSRKSSRRWPMGMHRCVIVSVIIST